MDKLLEMYMEEEYKDILNNYLIGYERAGEFNFSTETDNNIISSYMRNLSTSDAWKQVRRAVYYYSFLILSVEEVDTIIEKVDECTDDEIRYILTMSQITEATIATNLYAGYISTYASVLPVPNDAIFDFLKPYVDDLLNNPKAEESILTKGIEKFALATFRKYNTENVESVILPVLDRITGKIV